MSFGAGYRAERGGFEGQDSRGRCVVPAVAVRFPALEVGFVIIGLVVVAAVVLGLVAGWYLRKKECWCERCGGHLVCASCEPDTPDAQAKARPRRRRRDPP
jgi:hypothetical protein